jgi:hypothetical protein
VKHTPPPNLGPLFAATVKESLTVAPHNGTATSKAAAKAIEPHINSQQQAMLHWYRTYGSNGVTDQEMVDSSGFSGDSVRPRRGELVSMGLVVDSGRTRATKTGRQATVFVAKEFA